ncbi:hypothetical protein QBC36DRAFT_325367 [Triangularia setosa]|uniref:Uncharacterized protein n=1 Tax=Triangularia setosa TaxID=2587417 RepID=A0AAN6WBU5_9PEZI|nr:hypothetical protein QBC36DRAFT_325367 [Podospora setosa]
MQSPATRQSLAFRSAFSVQIPPHLTDSLQATMPNDLRLPFPRLSSSDPNGSDANSSVQVQLDALSNRGRSATGASQSPSRLPSPSRTSGPEPITEQHSNQSNSQSSQLSIDIVLCRPREDPILPEHVLIGLAGQKRPYDDGAIDEDEQRYAKRDRMTEELELMSPSAHAPTTPFPLSSAPTGVPSISVADFDDIDRLLAPGRHQPPIFQPDLQTVVIGNRKTLPIRSVSRRLPPQERTDVPGASNKQEDEELDEGGDEQNTGEYQR